MSLGLTLRELLALTESAAPNATKWGEIDKVLRLLYERYTRVQDEQLRRLEELERDRILKLTADSMLTRSDSSTRAKPRAYKAKIHTGQLTKLTWMERQKPGYDPPPENARKRKITDSGRTGSPDVTDSKRKTRVDQAEQPTKIAKVDQEAYLHLPLWMVRNPTEEMRAFLQTQDCSRLYQLGPPLVFH
ncbi:unnamed protein product [Dicrocoelium dendriticum]|nr:unnamed protein product [Dicrocoelium dendriticum]